MDLLTIRVAVLGRWMEDKTKNGLDPMLPLYLSAEFLPLERVVKLMRCCHALRRDLPKSVARLEARDISYNSNVSQVEVSSSLMLIMLFA
jgi:hypothetical protein